MARVVTVGVLARDAGLDLDEALVTVWDAGFETIEDIDTHVPQRLIAPIRVALGLTNPKNQMQLSYWEQQWGLGRAELERKLETEFDITIRPGSRVLPKGALKRLNRTELVSSMPIELPRAALPQAEIPQFGPLEWKPPGHRKDALALTVEEICSVHEALVRDFVKSGDPINPPGVRDDHLLRSAASRPETSLNGIRKYDTIESYAAALLHSLVHNHPFYNGNKRTALVSMLVFLDRNGYLLTCTEKDLFRQVLRVAQHRLVARSAPDRADREVLAIAQWVCTNSRPIRRGERVLKWNELRRTLIKLGCTVGSPLPGNRLKIERHVEERWLLNIKRAKTLRFTAGYRNDGSEVGSGQLRELRKELWLDEAHGVDSDYFYGTDPREPDEFIAEYRGLLTRLGRL